MKKYETKKSFLEEGLIRYFSAYSRSKISSISSTVRHFNRIFICSQAPRPKLFVKETGSVILWRTGGQQFDEEGKHRERGKKLKVGPMDSDDKNGLK